MAQLKDSGAVGNMGLLTQYETETGRLCRTLRLSASEDGKSVRLIETDERKVGMQREYRFEITTGELIALIRAHGAELPGENYGTTMSASEEQIYRSRPDRLHRVNYVPKAQFYMTS